MGNKPLTNKSLGRWILYLVHNRTTLMRSLHILVNRAAGNDSEFHDLLTDEEMGLQKDG